VNGPLTTPLGGPCDLIAAAALLALRDLWSAGEATKADFALVDGGPARTPARYDEWCQFQGVGGAPILRDLTRGRWPNKVCNQRNRFTLEFLNQARPRALTRDVTCTRIVGHTGRHAAASDGRIVAVWGYRP
jgi:hypothetical protein